MRLAPVAAFLAAALTDAAAQGWVVSPAREEVSIAAGQTRTMVVRVQRDDPAGSGGSPVRFTVVPGDWDLTRRGSVIYAPAGSLPDSACAWAMFSPAEFTLEPGGAAHVRVSVTVPESTPAGLYRMALFYEEHSAVPPARADEKRVVFRYRLSTFVYVIVPDAAGRLDLAEVSASGDEDRVVRAVLRNLGNLHLRPTHWVEVRDAAGDTIATSDRSPAPVVLPGREVDVQVPIPAVPDGSRPATIRYLVDPGAPQPLRAMTLPFEGDATP